MSEKIMSSFGMEKWKKISADNHEYRRDYYVSNYGRVVSKEKISGKEFLNKPSLNSVTGYYTIAVVDRTGTKKIKLVHHLVANCFNLKKENDEATIISFKDGDKSNLHISNLKYITMKELYKKSIVKYRKEGNKIKGYQKLNIMQVKRIKKQLKRGKIRKAKLARLYNVSETQIARIERGENWGHVEV